jgi:hypothetical protein
VGSGVVKAYEDIYAEQLLFLRCLGQIICRLRFGTAPATEESKK